MSNSLQFKTKRPNPIVIFFALALLLQAQAMATPEPAAGADGGTAERSAERQAERPGNRPFGWIGVDLHNERVQDSTATTESASNSRLYRISIGSGATFDWVPRHSFTGGLIVKSDHGFASNGELSGFAMALSFGWLSPSNPGRGQFSLEAQYTFFAELKSNSGIVETQFREGTGWSLAARWLTNWSMNNNQVSLGPSLTLEQMTFAKSRIGSLPETDNKRVIDSLRPGIVTWFYF